MEEYLSSSSYLIEEFIEDALVEQELYYYLAIVVLLRLREGVMKIHSRRNENPASIYGTCTLPVLIGECTTISSKHIYVHSGI